MHAHAVLHFFRARTMRLHELSCRDKEDCQLLLPGFDPYGQVT